MGMIQDLPEDVMCIILRKVAKSSCIDLASVSATSPALRGMVNANRSSLYEVLNILPLLHFARWSNSQSEVLQNCIECGNTESQFWFGLWCFRVQGDWNRALKNLEEAKDNDHQMALYAWTMLSVLHAEELEEEDWANMEEFYSYFPSPSLPRYILEFLISQFQVLSVGVADIRIMLILTSCKVPWHYFFAGGNPDCVKCLLDEDAGAFLEFLTG